MTATVTRTTHAGPEHDRLMRRRRYFGLVAILTVVAVSVAGYFSLALGIRPIQITPFTHYQRAPYVQTFDPIALVLSGRSADSRGLDYPVSPLQLRAVVVSPGEVRMIESGQTLRVVDHEGGWQIADLARAISDPAWITLKDDDQTVRLNAALIVDGGEVAVSGVQRLNMSDAPSVFIGATGGRLTFRGVAVDAVESNDPAVPGYQPFVMATEGARMDISGSTFTNLGWDWNSSYGVTWAELATGSVRDSSFTHNFIGFYTNNARDIEVTDSTFSHNALYGVDPHTYSSALTFTRVTAEHNGAHGIIFSDHVTDSRVIDSVSRYNGENGIMMDEYSTANLITGNLVAGNGGDGLVTAASADNQFRGNRVQGNRIGVRLDPADTASTVAVDNEVVDNRLAAEHIALGPTNHQASNGGQWLAPRVAAIWGLAALGWLVAVVVAGIRARRWRPGYA